MNNLNSSVLLAFLFKLSTNFTALRNYTNIENYKNEKINKYLKNVSTVKQANEKINTCIENLVIKKFDFLNNI